MMNSNSLDKESVFNFFVEQFADVKIMRYQVPGFEKLSLNKKTLLYYLSEAAKSGRDILFDQHSKYNLLVRHNLENIFRTYTGDRNSTSFDAFTVYLKRIWFSNGIHHHYSQDKFKPEFTADFFKELFAHSDLNGFKNGNCKNREELKDLLTNIIFNPEIQDKRVNQAEGQDIIMTSAVNFYENVSQKKAEAYYNSLKDEKNQNPVSHGLNSKLINNNGILLEKTYKLNGLYSEAIKRIIYWLEKALTVAENETQQNIISLLIDYYKTGDLKTWDEYNIAWVKDTVSEIDFVNGFIETYTDPLGLKATWESVVNFIDKEATKRTQIISDNAAWFEKNAPVSEEYKKKEVKGVSAKVINVVQLGGDCYPTTPIGINLPNADWIRKIHGSKSVTLENITYAYEQVSLDSGFLEEFSYNEQEIELCRKYAASMSNLHTDLHECLGHGSGQLKEGVSPDALKNYHSPIEEARADLFALYFIMNPKLVELGIVPDSEAPKAEYITYFRNGLMTQLRRIEPGKNIEQAHMRNRQLITTWCYEKGLGENVIEKVIKEDKTYFVIKDFLKLRGFIGVLLKEIQRIKSEGDYTAAKELIENYAVKPNKEIHEEVIKRFEKLNIAPYGGFINPELVAHNNAEGNISDVTLDYSKSYTEQMLQYAKDYSFLPV
jgi:dipeptidyl-peptidase-3